MPAPYVDEGNACGPFEVANLPYEPLLQLDEIQGNVLGGFNKDHQTLIYVRLENELEPFRAWLRGAIQTIATAQEVVQFNRLFKAMLTRRSGQPEPSPPLQVTWINISFSHHALRRLSRGTLGDLQERDFDDPAFRAGMAERAVDVLGDPADRRSAGNPANWEFGGRNEVDLLVIVASDSRAAMRAEVHRLRGELTTVAAVLGMDEGENGPQQRDHFGFREGISQPGVRGVCSPWPDDFLTPRLNPHDVDEGLPGQKLVWPGEFVLGYPDELQAALYLSGKLAPQADIPPVPPEVGPDWALNGSFLAFRRLRQDVASFDEQIATESERLQIAPEALKARLLGRWPNGAPLGAELREPDEATGADSCRNNSFGFRNRVAQEVCPADAHIRKAYPRDDVPNEQRLHRILRRGISYTRPPDGAAGDAERGLLFLAYQASLDRQFEYITRRMENGDLLASQNQVGVHYLPLPGGETMEIRWPKPFVVPTGGGYFFTPSIWALTKLADPGGSWTPKTTAAMLHDRVKFAYYALGRFIYEQAPYATGPDLILSADFYHTAKGGELEIKSDGLAQDFGIHPLDNKPQQLFKRSSNQLADTDQFDCLWWYFRGAVQRVTKAIRIPYRYRRGGQLNEVESALLIGFSGPGSE
ncbi:MAG: Dyp-type peroxidase [Chloroflexota bacterium]